MKQLFSMNDNIYFKLTATGHEILNRNAEEFHRENPQVDIQYKWSTYKDDWYKQQFWSLFREFVNMSFAGCMLPIYDMTFIDPTKELAEGME